MFGLYIQGNSRGILSFLFDVLPIEFVFGRLYEPWYGIFTQRNTLGIMMAFAIFVFYLRSRSDPEEKWSAYLWASLSFLLLFLSGSLTGFLGLWAVMVGGVLLGNIRRHRRWARRILLATAVIGGVGVYYAASHPAICDFLFRPRRYSYRSHNHLGGFAAFGDGSPLDRSRVQCLLARG